MIPFVMTSSVSCRLKMDGIYIIGSGWLHILLIIFLILPFGCLCFQVGG